MIGVIRNGEMPFTEVQDRADLRRYVEMRESYDWETIQDMYDTVKLMTADKEQENYVALFQKDTAPQKILKNQVRVVAKVGAITFVGSTAQVFFSKTIKPMSTVQDSQNGMRPQNRILGRHDFVPPRQPARVGDGARARPDRLPRHKLQRRSRLDALRRDAGGASARREGAS